MTKLPLADKSAFENGDLDVSVAQDDNVCIVEVGFYEDKTGETFAAVGSSKRAQGDKRDPVFGYKLALARALATLSEDVLASVGFFYDE